MAKIPISSIEATNGRISVQVGKQHIATIPCRDLLKHLRTVDDEIRRNPGCPHPAEAVIDLVDDGRIDGASAEDRGVYALSLIHSALNSAQGGDRMRAEMVKDLRKEGHAVMAVVSKREQRDQRGRATSRTAHDTAPEIRDDDFPAVVSGAGYPIDGVLRRRLKVVREAEAAGDHSLTDRTSFRVFAHYLQRNLLAGPYSTLLAEVDHAFDLRDFYQVYDETGFPPNAIERLRNLPERRIHSYSPVSPWVYTATDRDADEPPPTVASGVSFVRTGDRLVWLLLGGPVLDLAAQAEWLVPLLRSAPIGMDEKRARGMRPVPLDGTTDVWELTLWGTLDLTTGERGVFGVSVNVGITIDCFLDLQGPQKRLTGVDDAGRAFVDRLGLQDLSCALDDFLQLPLYFQARVEYVRDEPARPRARGTGPHGNRQPPENYRYRTVATLHAVTRPGGASAADDKPPETAVEAEEARTRRAPDYQVTLDGTWRTLRPTQIGRGPDGKPEIGRTWVREHERYKDKPPRPNQIRVKQPVAASIEAASRETTDGRVTVRY